MTDIKAIKESNIARGHPERVIKMERVIITALSMEKTALSMEEKKEETVSFNEEITIIPQKPEEKYGGTKKHKDDEAIEMIYAVNDLDNIADEKLLKEIEKLKKDLNK